MIVGKATRIPVRIDWYHTLQKAILIDSRVNPVITKFLIFRKALIYRLATHLVPVSCAAAEDIQTTFHVAPSKCTVIHNLLADPLSTIISREIERQVVITCVGRLDQSKGHDVLVQALHLLNKQFPNVCVRFIGDGPRKSHLINLAASLGIADNFVFTGNISHDNVLIELSNSYLTVHPTRSESFGYAVLESIAVGTPVVASNVGGIPEIIRDGVEGFLVPPDSPEALANAIEKILKSPELRETLSKNARERFLSTFELTNGVQDIITWLTATIDART